METLSRILIESTSLFTRISPYMIVGFGVSGILHLFVDAEFINRNLRRGRMSVLKAVIFGVPLPVCSCGVIPIAASLKRQGAGKAAILSFLYSTPVTGIDSILVTYALLGSAFAIFRPLAAFTGGIIIGLTALAFNRGNPMQELPSSATTPRKRSLKDALYYSFVYLPGEIGKWVMIGVFLGGAVSVMLPAEFGSYLSNPYFAYPGVLLISIPVYVCATGSVPLAAALIAKGLSPGAALTFLIAGPATNTVTATFVFKDLGKRYAFLYLAGITLTSVAFGIIFDKIVGFFGIEPAFHTFVSDSGTGIVAQIAALVLAGIITYSLLKTRIRSKEEGSMRLILKVPDMSCEGCVYTIKTRLQQLEEVKNVRVDLRTHEVHVDTELPPDVIKETINEAGYEVKEVQNARIH